MWYRALHWGTYLHLFSSSNVLKVVLRCSNESWGVRQGRFYLFTCLWEVVSIRLPWYHDPSGRATDHGPRTRLLILVDYSAGVFTCVSGTRRTWRLCTLSIPPTSSESSGTFSNLWSGTDVPEHTWGLAGSSLAALGHAAADSSSSSSLFAVTSLGGSWRMWTTWLSFGNTWTTSSSSSLQKCSGRCSSARTPNGSDAQRLLTVFIVSPQTWRGAASDSERRTPALCENTPAPAPPAHPAVWR